MDIKEYTVTAEQRNGMVDFKPVVTVTPVKATLVKWVWSTTPRLELAPVDKTEPVV